MPSASKMSTPVAVDLEVIQGRYALLGGYTVAFETFKQDVDPAALFVGLPDDRCQCEHWGVVTEGQITFRWADRQETYVAGDAFYRAGWPSAPGRGRHVGRRVQPQRGPR